MLYSVKSLKDGVLLPCSRANLDGVIILGKSSDKLLDSGGNLLITTPTGKKLTWSSIRELNEEKQREILK